VSIPANGPLNHDPRILGLSEDESLQLLEELSEVFSASLPRKHRHVVVRAPPAGAHQIVMACQTPTYIIQPRSV
jgi:hypothetical protein